MPDVQVPRLSDSMETGKIIRWLKKEGDEVKKGEPLVEIESDKANIEVEAYASGKLSKIAVKEGDSAPIGAVIATIGEPSPGAAHFSGGPRAASREGLCHGTTRRSRGFGRRAIPAGCARRPDRGGRGVSRGAGHAAAASPR